MRTVKLIVLPIVITFLLAMFSYAGLLALASETYVECLTYVGIAIVSIMFLLYSANELITIFLFFD